MLLLDKTLLRLSKGLWGWIVAIVVVRFAQLIGVTLFAEVIGAFLGNLASPQPDTTKLVAAAAAAAAASLLTLVARLAQGELQYRTTAFARVHLREVIFDKVLALDVGGIEKIGPVSAITSSVDAVEQMQTYYSLYLPSLIFSGIAPIYLFFHLAPLSLSIAVLLLVVSVVLLPLNNLFRHQIEALRRRYWISVEDMTAYFLDSLRGLTSIKLFGRDADRSQTLQSKASRLSADINEFMRINFSSHFVNEALIYLAITIALVIVCFDLAAARMTVGSGLTILLLAYGYFASIRQLMDATHDALTAVSAATKVEDIFAVDTSRANNPQAPSDPETYDGIRLEDVSFSYPESQNRMALQNVSLRVPRGKTIALVGLSGCGKSTVAALLARFIDPTVGNLYIEGQNYLSLTPEELRYHVAMVPQTVSLFTGTIRENLQIAAPHANDEKLYEALNEAALGDWVRSLPDKLDTAVGDAGSRLSGGQRQKMGIARVLLSQAKYLIFDESTSSVDEESEREIWHCIHQLSRNRTLVIISHRLSTIRWADCIYVLEQGRITAQGTHDELMQHKGLYQQLVAEQAKLEGAAA